MRNNINIAYNAPEKFIFDADEIEVIPSGARLKLIAHPGQIFTQEFISDENFPAYDTSKIEFVGGVARQKYQAPVDAILGVTFTTGINPSWSVPTPTTVTTRGTVNWSPLGRVEVFGYGNNSLIYDNPAIGNMDGAGCVRFKLTPGYSGIPTGIPNILEISTGSGNVNLIILAHTSTGGSLRLTTGNSAGTIIHSSASLGNWTPVSGQTYIFELNFNTTLGTINLFIDGVLKGALAFVTTRGTTATKMYFGAGNSYLTTNYAYDDIEIFNALQHTANFTPAYTVPETLYAAVSLVSPITQQIGPGTQQGFDSFSATVTGDVKFAFKTDLTPYFLYWNGSAWRESVTEDNANTPADFNAYIPELDILGSSEDQYRIYFSAGNIQKSILIYTSTLTTETYEHDFPPYIETIQYFFNIQLLSVVWATTLPVNTSFSFMLAKDDIWYYYSEGAWITSNGTAAESCALTSPVTTFNTGAQVKTKIRVFFHTDGAATPVLIGCNWVFSSVLFFNTATVKQNNAYDLVRDVNPTTNEKSPEYLNGTSWFNLLTGESWLLIDDTDGTWQETDTDKTNRIIEMEDHITYFILQYLSNPFVASRTKDIIVPPSGVTITQEKLFHLLTYECVYWPGVFSATDNSITFQDFSGDLTDFLLSDDKVLVQGSLRNNKYFTVTQVFQNKLTVNENVANETCTAFFCWVEIPQHVIVLIARLLWYDLYQRPSTTGFKSETIGTYSYTLNSMSTGLSYPDDLTRDLLGYENASLGGIPFYVK